MRPSSEGKIVSRTAWSPTAIAGAVLLAVLVGAAWLARLALHRAVLASPVVLPAAWLALAAAWIVLTCSLWIESVALRRAWRMRTAQATGLTSLAEGTKFRSLLRRLPDPVERLARPWFGTGVGRRMASDWSDAGLGDKASRYLLLILAAAIAGAMLGARMGGPILGAAIGLAAPILPWQAITRRAHAHQLAFGEQLPHALDVLGSGLSAGLSFQQAVEYTAAETSVPVSRAFARLARWMALGHSADESLRHVLATIPEESLALAAEGIELQRQVGGDLVGMLAGCAGQLRERVELEREVRAVTAQRRLSGIVIAGLVPVSAGILLTANPRYVDVLFDSLAGQVLLALALGLLLVGWVVISRLMRVRY